MMFFFGVTRFDFIAANLDEGCTDLFLALFTVSVIVFILSSSSLRDKVAYGNIDSLLAPRIKEAGLSIPLFRDK